MSQYVDGLVGPLIIKNPNNPGPLAYDEEIVIPLSDWYHTDSEDLLSHYLSRASKGEEVIQFMKIIQEDSMLKFSTTAFSRQCFDLWYRIERMYRLRPSR